MSRAIALIVLLVGCAIGGVPEPDNVEVAAPAGADEAAEVVVQEWSERLPYAARLSVAAAGAMIHGSVPHL